MKKQRYIVEIEMPDGDFISAGCLKDLIQTDCDVEDESRKKVTVQETSIPSNLDEAAEEYAYNNWEDNDYHTGASEGLPFDAIGHTEKCFKAGAEWREQQIPKLPDNLDKAAEKYAKENCENYVDEEDGVTYIEEALRNTFKAGALWMAGRGVTCEGVIFGEKYFRHKNVEMHLSDEQYDKVGDFGDKVVVQIRKK